MKKDHRGRQKSFSIQGHTMEVYQRMVTFVGTIIFFPNFFFKAHPTILISGFMVATVQKHTFRMEGHLFICNISKTLDKRSGKCKRGPRYMSSFTMSFPKALNHTGSSIFFGPCIFHKEGHAS
ncbi:hypothetical protein THRCLA_20743 [Thraustotheca clavata]|uniref:Transmembrane protein n=1 Tax=Thraustotheca clavata TaxID=74557 RepID=A0A1W0A419_9STRA|nr:hypothetical protein THRCLA_20743 [Thraustotheca clavata]